MGHHFIRRNDSVEPLRRSCRNGKPWFATTLVLLAIATVITSARPGAGFQTVDSNGYVTLMDVREYAGTGFGGENAHVVRLDFQLFANSSSGGSGSTTGGPSTTGSTTGAPTTTGTTTGGADPGGPPTPNGSAKAAQSYRMKPRPWIMRRGERPGAGEGALARPTSADMIDAPPSKAIGGVTPIDPEPTTAGSGTTGSATTGSSTTGSSTTGSATTGSSTTTGTSTTGTSGGGSSWSTTESSNTYFGVDTAYGTGLTVGGQHPANGDYAGHGVFAYSYTRGTHFEVRLPGAANRNVHLVITASGHNYHSDSSGNTVDDGPWSTTLIYSSALALTRRDTPSVSIDTRRVYGQPNLDGELPADPNAELRNPSFAGWSYKGGLFIGNATGKDQSGTARIQAYVPPAAFTYPLASSYTLLALGRPQPFLSPVSWEGFVPSTNDPNLATSVGTVTWANKWDLLSGTLIAANPGGPPPDGEYDRLFFVGNASRIGLTLASEASMVGSGYGLWQYFASDAFESSYAGPFPYSDSRPRTWTVDRLSQNGAVYQ